MRRTWGLLFWLLGCGDAALGNDPPVGQGGAAPTDSAERPLLGPHAWGDGSLTIAVRSTRAERIEAWLYADGAEHESLRVALMRDGELFSARIPSTDLAAAGLSEPVIYGLRAWGPNWVWNPEWTKGSLAGFVSDVDELGNRFNPNKLLLDPYAREMTHDPSRPGHTGWSIFTSGPEHRSDDSAARAPKGIALAEDGVDPGAHSPRALKDHVIYEVHVRGFTMNDPRVPEALRGTYAGAALKAGYLADLGVTAIELLPLHETQNEQNDIDPDSASGDNYWGYSSLSFFAPERRYAADKSPGGPTRELKEMVRAFHDAGIAVIADIVFNHTGESGTWDSAGQVAPLLSWRGIDNAAYYQLAGAPEHYANNNGVGPNVSATHPLARDLIVDALKYWHEALGIDGFRFDLASVLGNSCETACFHFDAGPDGLLTRIREALPDALLIAEPWGIGPGTYQLGQFPEGWAEWNGQYRDQIRSDQNRHDIVDVTPGGLANRLSGSWELFGDDGRKPWSSINFIVAHDGLTLRDLYACNGKNNNQPWPFGPSDGGSDDNIAWDHGGDVERQRHAARTGLALLMLSAGVPMITGGDELYRTQRCNNNTYNLDSVANWIDWSNLDDEASFHHFARGLMRFRNAHPALRPDAFRPAGDADDNGLDTITWYQPNGSVASGGYLDDPDNHFIAFRLDGGEAGDSARSLFIAYNGGLTGVSVSLPAPGTGHRWYLVADTHPWLEADNNLLGPGTEEPIPGGDAPGASYLLGTRSVLLLIEQP